MTGDWHAYDHYAYAAAALVGTIAGAVLLLYVLLHRRWRARWEQWHGIVPPFINVIGVLFGLTLAFLANDTWNAHDRAIAAVNREGDALRSMVILAANLPTERSAAVRGATLVYAREAAREWPLLAQREVSPAANRAAEALLATVASPDIAGASGPAISAKQIQLATEIGEARETRIALSQTHVNPLKWAGMAFLGFVTMLSVAMVHLGQPRAMIASVALFALASAPTAVIVLVHGNPFQPPAAVLATPLTAFVAAEAG